MYLDLLPIAYLKVPKDSKAKHNQESTQKYHASSDTLACIQNIVLQKAQLILNTVENILT